MAILEGWPNIQLEIRKTISAIDAKKKIVVIETYPGVDHSELLNSFTAAIGPSLLVNMADLYFAETEIDEITFQDVTDDRIFGYMTRLQIGHFIDPQKLEGVKSKIDALSEGTILIIGTGAAEISNHIDLLVYADMARWEIQMRMRRKEVANLGVNNFDLEIARKYKRAFFVDWPVADRIKKKTFQRWDFYLDSNLPGKPKLISAQQYQLGLKQSVQQPFRVVPFFDPGPWGGQWMKEVCDLDRSVDNFAWCFDCVPEENSLLLQYGDQLIETPSINLVYFQSIPLLGEKIFARFGAEFPIRFDFLDTMGGGNLSLQVHPLTEYIREHFGMFYTQDESYYMLDTGADAVVYLGLNEGISPDEMISDLRIAQEGQIPFDADKYVAKWPVKKHDHLLIPAGTVHCSGIDSMVLEISATPFIFTFKLWDWGRMGMDGLPRPINIEHGKEVIDWTRTAAWVEKNLIHQNRLVAQGQGWREESTGLHEYEFIETRRHWFTEPVLHQTNGDLNVLNLIEGEEAIVESPDSSFEPFVIHYAETFIVPANISTYTIRPFGLSEGKEIATIKAYVRS
ncbi:MAG: class I mannose-6-phosphate isomerase [Saprospiraceae bacterium]